MSTLQERGRKCMVFKNLIEDGAYRLVICPKCKTRNIVKVLETTKFVQCLACPRFILIKKEGGDESGG